MQLRIRPRQTALPRVARRAIERRLRLAVGRHAGAVRLAEAALSPLPGAADPPRTRCRIRLVLRAGGTLAVEDHGDNPFAAVVAAAWRLEHRLERSRPTPVRGRAAIGRMGRVET